MKTELKLNGDVVELWYNNQKIGEVSGTAGPGVKVSSAHSMLPQWHADSGDVKWLELRIASEPVGREVEFPPKRAQGW